MLHSCLDLADVRQVLKRASWITADFPVRLDLLFAAWVFSSKDFQRPAARASFTTDSTEQTKHDDSAA